MLTGQIIDHLRTQASDVKALNIHPPPYYHKKDRKQFKWGIEEKGEAISNCLPGGRTFNRPDNEFPKGKLEAVGIRGNSESDVTAFGPGSIGEFGGLFPYACWCILVVQ
jgi:hypothetical protein